MGEIDDFVNDGFSSKGTEGGEGVRYPGDSFSWVLHHHKISKQTYDGMYVAQRGCCAICGTHQSELKRRLCIDHDHATGKIRGLLCGTCNSMLGFAGDNPQILANAIEYLKGTE